MPVIDLEVTSLRELNKMLHGLGEGTNETYFRVINPRGRHAIAAGLDAPVTVEIDGNAGYYCAGMNKQATVIVNGSAGVGLAENMMSGKVHVKGDASSSAGATGCGGLLIIDGNAAARCGISSRGINIVVKGSVGHMSGFMAQAGTLVVLGDAGEALGDSIYEARIFVRGKVKGLGADCIEKPLKEEHRTQLGKLLTEAGLDGQVDPSEFRRYGSGRTLYHFHMDNLEAY
jgi:glutamate synthase domain-containing protein 3